MQKNYDIIIVGAGMVGLMLAQLLKNSGLHIALLEASSEQPAWPGEDYDNRVSALNKNSQLLLQQVGCWQAIQAMRVSPYHKMQVWEQNGDYQLKFNAADNADDYLGYIVENTVIRKALLDALPNTIDLICPANIIAIASNSITLASGEQLKTKLIVAADGAKSWVRKQFNFEVATYSYQQQAIVATVKTEQAHNLTAYQCFLTTGPLAFLPLDNQHYSSIVWSADEQIATQLLDLPEAEFEQALAEAFEHTLGKITLQSKPQKYPLRMRHATDYVKAGIVLMGDALRTMHPLAGQGVNFGFKDAQTLAEIILAAHAKQRDFASLHNLKKYQRARKLETVAAIVAMEFFKQIFSETSPRLKQYRKQIMMFIQGNDFIKHQFTQIASGVPGI
jgi:2-octaprenylphenol hydroxylase